MSIKVHHGAPGAYKTSGAIADDVVEQIFQGRVLVTNVRGLDNTDRVRDVLESNFKKRKVPPTFEIIWVDSDSEDGLNRLARWFHWVPDGAFLLIDEAQDVWPEDWKDVALKLLDYPGGPDAAQADRRPKGFKDAFQRHRHFNWDMVLTCQDIGQLRKDIRAVCETAHYHKNMAVNGIRGRYMEAIHMASRSAIESHFMQVNPKKVPAYVFDLYQSTKTGVVSDSSSGTPFWKSGRFLFLMAIFFSVWIFVLYQGLPSFFRAKEDRRARSGDSATSEKGMDKKAVLSSGKNGHPSGDTPGGVPVNSFDLLGQDTVSIVGYYEKSGVGYYQFELIRDGEILGPVVDQSVVEKLGYSVTYLSRCLVDLKDSRETHVFVRCRGVVDEKQDL
ncbi:MAG: hypothetical protein HQL75_07230 [Magnetococcales bacterium]|nr:hypothetical protein [Magnetococcales bacterium]